MLSLRSDHHRYWWCQVISVFLRPTPFGKDKPPASIGLLLIYCHYQSTQIEWKNTSWKHYVDDFRISCHVVFLGRYLIG